MKSGQFYALLVMVAVLAGCASSAQRAPVIERGEAPKRSVDAVDETRKKLAREKDWRPQIHVVQKGDTLYSIAFDYGFDYHELAELNGIQDPGVIQIGQQIRLFPGGARPIIPPAAVEIKPIVPAVREQPRLAKYEYSDAAVAQIEKVQQLTQPVTGVAESKPRPEPRPEPKPQTGADAVADNGEDEALEWSMPAQGKLVAGFSGSSSKGIDIAGSLGQPILASAPGKVVYSGSGLRGYGKLVIIKHNKTYLSAYAHNDQVLVKEGQNVTRGQKIAEMGNTDADQVKLHFEVRRFGKPVDPAKYLPLNNS